eukprot:6470354-Alexandrium_andersonii.AAC.1
MCIRDSGRPPGEAPGASLITTCLVSRGRLDSAATQHACAQASRHPRGALPPRHRVGRDAG